jgi:hypothetical protein
MDFSTLSTTDLVLMIAVVVIVIAGAATFLFMRKRRTAGLRTQFGGQEYDRALQEGGNRRKAEAGLQDRKERVESFHVRELSAADHARFVEAWRGVQTRFVDSPAGVVSEADTLLGDVMLARGYPVSDFAQRGADISVDHPLVMENYRAAHGIAIRQKAGQASTEELRQAMIHYRTLFEELVGMPEKAQAKAAGAGTSV